MWIVIRDFGFEETFNEFTRTHDLDPTSWCRAGRHGSDDDRTVSVLQTSLAYEKFCNDFNKKISVKNKVIRIRTFYDGDREGENGAPVPAYEALATSEEAAEHFHDWSAQDVGTTHSMIEDHNGHWNYYIG